MVPSTNTPAASRRFLPSSSDRLNTPKPAWPTSGRQGSQFSSSVRPSSQFAKTPHFSKSFGSAEDDIDVSFESDDVSPSVKRLRQESVSASARREDLVENDEEGFGQGLNHRTTAGIGFKPERLDIDDYLDDYDASIVKRRPPKHKDVSDELTLDNLPKPAPKRLKKSTADAPDRDTIVISSSSEDDQNVLEDEDDGRAAPRKVNSGFNSDDDIPISPKRVRSAASSRFKMPAPATASPNEAHSRPVFKPPSAQFPGKTSSSSVAALPNAFSPSRRKGKKEYLPGGSADIVRGWILALAASESRYASEVGETIKVASVTHDVEGRCVTVEDENQRRWLLVSQEGRSDAGWSNQTDVGKIRGGDVVEIKIGGTSWSLLLPGSSSVREEDTDLTASRLEISVLWNIKR